MNKILLVSLLLFAALLGALAQGLFRKSSPQLGLSMLTNWMLIAGVALYGVAFLINIYAYQAGGDVSLVYPTLAATQVFAFFLAWLWLGETITMAKAAGAGLIVAGIAVLWL